MQKIHQSITIAASKQKVWNHIVDAEKYKIWTKVFTPETYSDSHFEGGWNQGDKIKFLSKDENGDVSGLTSTIAESVLFERISIQHLGFIKNGVEDFDSEEVKKWTPSFENYTLIEKGPEVTEFVVDMEVADEYKEEMERLWIEALEKMKESCEQKFENLAIETTVKNDIATVWDCWNLPEHVKNWNFAIDTWECPKAENDLRVGGRFLYTMAAKDGSFSFDFSGTYTKIEDHKAIEYILDDGRKVQVQMQETEENVLINQNFEAEATNSLEMQKTGWQSILDNFKAYCEKK